MNRSKTIQELEVRALKLTPAERARLAAKLLASLETLSEAENERLWATEAARRDAELDAGRSRQHSAKEVFRTARARLK